VGSALRVSEAASLALHGAAYLAQAGQTPVANKEMADALGVSEAHLSKVMQRLSKAGLVRSVRGPKGGFLLDTPADQISLLDVYEAIEGRLEDTSCLLGTPVCRGERCILGGLIERVNREVRTYLTRTRLSEMTSIYRRPDGDAQKHHQDR